jgi:4-amino-4-deoxy-L-arabinose transferase-like glycosyltransferase
MLAVLFLPGLDDLSNYHGDESLWLSVSGKLFRLFAIDRNLTHPIWQKEYSTFGASQPQIGKYLIGLGVSFTGFKGNPIDYYWHWDQNRAWNLAHVVPPRDVVASGRLPIALLGIVACLAFYWLVTLVVNEWCALLALASLLSAPLLRVSSRRAMIDTPALTFGLLTLVALVYLLRALRAGYWRRAVWWAVPAGLCAGLAIGTKLHALLVLIVCFTALIAEAAYALRMSQRHMTAAIVCLAVLGVGAWLVFYGSNPFLYPHPITGVQHLLALNAMVAGIPMQQLTTTPQRIMAVWRSLQTYAPLAQLGLPLGPWLIGLGIIAVGAAARQGYATLRARQLDLILLWISVSVVGITLWLPHDWDRYYLPLQPCIALLQAYGIWWCGATCLSFGRERWPRVKIRMSQP